MSSSYAFYTDLYISVSFLVNNDVLCFNPLVFTPTLVMQLTAWKDETTRLKALLKEREDHTSSNEVEKEALTKIEVNDGFPYYTTTIIKTSTSYLFSFSIPIY